MGCHIPYFFFRNSSFIVVKYFKIEKTITGINRYKYIHDTLKKVQIQNESKIKNYKENA